MKVYIGSDHAGFKVKEKLKAFLAKKKIEFGDMGTINGEKSVDYPDYAKKVCKQVLKAKDHLGILICGTGTGMCIQANRYKGIRAATAYDTYSAKMSKHDNNSNVLCLRGRQFPYDKIEKIVSTWLKSDFSKIPRHKRRIGKLDRK